MARARTEPKAGPKPFDPAPWENREEWGRLLVATYTDAREEYPDFVAWVRYVVKQTGHSERELMRVARNRAFHVKLLALQREVRLRHREPEIRAKARWHRKLPETWMGLFLEEYRDRQDRIEAAMAVRKEWSEVEGQLDVNPEFLAAFQQVDHELTIRLEDAAFRGALEGKSAGERKLALESRSARFAKGAHGGNRLRRGPGPTKPISGPIRGPVQTWATIFGANERPQPIEESDVPTADPRGALPDSGEGLELAVTGSA